MTTTTPAPTPLPGGSREVWLVVSGLLLGQFLSAMDTLLVVTALPTIISDLGGAGQVSWIITAYLLTSTALSPLVGKLGDLYGRRRLYQFAIIGFVIGSMLAGAAQDMNQLIAARAVQGLGAAGLMTLPMAIIGDVAAPRDRPRYQGVMTSSMVVASIAGPLVGGFFVDQASWRYAFWINLPLGILALAATRRLPRSRRTTERVQLDVAGALLVVLTASCLLLVVNWGGERYAWGSGAIIGLSATTVVLAVLLVVVERHAAEPVLPGRIFRNRNVVLVVLGGMVSSFAMWGPWVLIPTFLQVVTGASATNSGLNLLPILLGLSATSVLVGRQISRTGRYRFYPALGSALSAVALVLYTTMDSSTTRVEAGAYMLVMGIGLGMLMQVLVIIAQASAAQRDIGVATAVVGFTRQIGGAIGAAVAVTVYTSQFADNLDVVFTPAQRASIGPEALRGGPEAIRALDPATADTLVEAFADALHRAFTFSVVPMVLAFGLFLFLRHQDLDLDLDQDLDGATPAPSPAAAPVPISTPGGHP